MMPYPEKLIPKNKHLCCAATGLALSMLGLLTSVGTSGTYLSLKVINSWKDHTNGTTVDHSIKMDVNDLKTSAYILVGIAAITIASVPVISCFLMLLANKLLNAAEKIKEWWHDNSVASRCCYPPVSDDRTYNDDEPYQDSINLGSNNSF
jgi:hypothetical protein